MECVITQKFHRIVMGAKGLKVQQITKDHSVLIKFPEREEPQGTGATAPLLRAVMIKSRI